MSRKTTKIAFNPDTMTVSDLKSCAETLSRILQDFDRCCKNEGYYVWDNLGSESFALSVLQVREAYELD